MNDVKVVITSQIVRDKGYVIPYDHRVVPHLQHYRGPNGISFPNRFVTYEVPLYEVRIVGGARYKAIRFAGTEVTWNRAAKKKALDAIFWSTKNRKPWSEFGPQPKWRSLWL